jgi:hypothetical protein
MVTGRQLISFNFVGRYLYERHYSASILSATIRSQMRRMQRTSLVDQPIIRPWRVQREPVAF